MSRRAVKMVDWAVILERVPAQQKNELAVFKSKCDQHLRRMTGNPESLPKIDWTYYEKNIPISGLVAKFKKEYETLSIPYPADKYTNLLDQEEKETLADIEQFNKECNKAIEAYKEEIAKIQAILPFAQMTMEDYAEAFPESAWNPDKPTVWPHTDEIAEAIETPYDPEHH